MMTKPATQHEVRWQRHYREAKGGGIVASSGAAAAINLADDGYEDEECCCGIWAAEIQDDGSRRMPNSACILQAAGAWLTTILCGTLEYCVGRAEYMVSSWLTHRQSVTMSPSSSTAVITSMMRSRRAWANRGLSVKGLIQMGSLLVGLF